LTKLVLKNSALFVCNL